MHSSCHLLLFLPLCLLLDSFLFILLLGFGLSKYSLCALYSHYTKGDRRGERTLCVCVCVRTVLLEMSTPIRCYCSVGKKKGFLFIPFLLACPDWSSTLCRSVWFPSTWLSSRNLPNYFWLFSGKESAQMQ